MSLVSWFKNASTAKKLATVSFAAINGLACINAGMISHRVEQAHPDAHSSILVNLTAGPLTTAMTWLASDEIAKHPARNAPAENSPFVFLGNQTKKILPKQIDAGLGVTVAIAGAPGAVVGYVTGIAAGATHRILKP